MRFLPAGQSSFLLAGESRSVLADRQCLSRAGSPRSPHNGRQHAGGRSLALSKNARVLRSVFPREAHSLRGKSATPLHKVLDVPRGRGAVEGSSRAELQRR